MKLDIKKLIREEITLALNEDATSFIKKWLFAARPTKVMGQSALQFSGPLADEWMTSYKTSTNTPVMKEFYKLLKPYRLHAERKGKNDIVVYGMPADMKKFLLFLDGNGATFVKSFK